jgi:hypothetical protein
MKQYLEKRVHFENRVFSNDNVYQSDFRLSGGKMDPQNGNDTGYLQP